MVVKLADQLVSREAFTHHDVNVLLGGKTVKKSINDLSTKYLKPLIGVELANFKEPLNITLRNHPRYLVHILLAHLENIQSWDRFSFSSSNIHFFS